MPAPPQNPYAQFGPSPMAAGATTGKPNPYARFSPRSVKPPMPDFLPRTAQVASGMVNQMIAGMQQTAPVTRKFSGEGTYAESLGPVFEMDSGEYGYRTPDGKAQYLDPQKHVVLYTPEGNLEAFTRSEATDTGPLTSLGHIATTGLMASPLSVRSGVSAPSRMAQTVAQFERQKIPPTLATATENRSAQNIHNMLKDFWPTASVVEGRDIAQLRAGMNTAEGLAAKYGVAATELDAGTAIKRGGESFINAPVKALSDSEVMLAPTRATSFGQKSGAAYSLVDKLIPAGAEVSMGKTLAAFDDIAGRFNLKALGERFQDPALKSIADILRKSNSGVITWSDARNLRTELGALMKKPELVTGVNEAQLKSLYAALSSDLEAAALATGGPKALRAWKRATQYYNAGLGRIRTGLSQLLKPSVSEEGAFALLMKTTQSGKSTESAARLQAIRRSMPDEDWNEVASTVIRQLGKPTSGAVDLTGKAPEFSAASFVTNYDKLSDTAKDLLFSGAGRQELRSALDELAQVMSRIRNTERLQNRSMTASGVNTLGTVVAGMAAPIRTVLGAIGTNLAARAMTNPGFVRWLAKLPEARTPTAFVAEVNRLSQLARLDPSLREIAFAVRAAGPSSDQNLGDTR